MATITEEARTEALAETSGRASAREVTMATEEKVASAVAAAAVVIKSIITLVRPHALLFKGC